MTDHMNYTVTDFNSTAVGSLNISVLDTPPIAVPDAYVKRKDMIHVLDILVNDYDPDGDEVTILSIGTCLGVAQISSDGKSVIYTPLASTQPYSDSFEYTITDGNQNIAVSYVTIQLYNTPPVAYNQSISVVKNIPNDVITLTYSDIDILDTHTIFISQQPANGYATLSNTTQVVSVAYADSTYNIPDNQYSITYTPQTGFDGSDSIQFTVVDCVGATSVGIVSITVVNLPPIAVPQGPYLVYVNTSLMITDLLTGDVDNDGDNVTLVPFTTITTQQGGTVTRLSGSSVLYIPPINYIGMDYFNYTIQDVVQNPADTLTSSALVTLNVTVKPEVVVPVPVVGDIITCSNNETTLFRGDLYTVSLPSACQSSGNATLQLILLSQPDIPVVKVLSADNQTLTFTTPLNQSGVWILTYQATDGFGYYSDVYNVTLNVVNRRPVSQDGVWSLLAMRTPNQTYSFNYFTNELPFDFDIYDNTRLTMSFESTDNCSNEGNLTIVDNTTVQFSKNMNFYSGNCEFWVTITDADLNIPQRLNTTHNITVNVYTTGLDANGVTMTVQNGNSLIPITTDYIMQNDKDPLGGTFHFVGFVYDNATCSQPGFCRNPMPIQTSGNTYLFTTQSHNCQPDYYKYRIQSDQHPTITADAVLTIEYIDCQCAVGMDVLILMDGSANIGKIKFEKTKTLINRFVSKLDVSQDTIHVALMRYDGQVNLSVPFTSDTTQFTTSVNNLQYSYQSTGTFLKTAYQQAINILNQRNRVINKLVVTLITGPPTGPCSCDSCSQVGLACNGYNVYPYRQCNACSKNYNPYLGCGPCADPREEALTINSNVTAGVSNWRNLVIGLGDDGLEADSTIQLLQDISFDKDKVYKIDWDDLDSYDLSYVIKTTCDVTPGQPTDNLDVVEPNQPDAMKCCDILTLRVKDNFFSLSIDDDDDDRCWVNINVNLYDSNSYRQNVFQVQCVPGKTGNLSYGDTIYLWSLKTKNYVSVDANGYLRANAFDLSSAQAFTLGAAGSVSGLAYVHSSFALQVSSGVYVAQGQAMSIDPDNDDAKFWFKKLKFDDVAGAGWKIKKEELPCQTQVSCPSQQMNIIWPPNQKLIWYDMDNEDDSMEFTVTAIYSNQDVYGRGSGHFCPEAIINTVKESTCYGELKIKQNQFALRAERDGSSGSGSARIYKVVFTGESKQSVSQCSGTFYYCVPHDMGDIDCSSVNATVTTWYDATKTCSDDDDDERDH